MQKRTVLAVAAIIACTVSCVSPRLTSVVDKTRIAKLSSVKIVFDGPNDQFNNWIAKKINANLNESGVVSDYSVASLSKSKELSLESDKTQNLLDKIIAECKKNDILICNMTRLNLLNGQISAVEMELMLYSKVHGKIVWKSELTTSAGFQSPFIIGEIADEITNKMRADGLL